MCINTSFSEPSHAGLDSAGVAVSLLLEYTENSKAPVSSLSQSSIIPCSICLAC